MGTSRAREGARPRHVGRSRLFEEDVSHAVDLKEHGRRPDCGHGGAGAGCRARAGNQEAVKTNLLAAQGSLAELIKLPAAAALQGDVRTAVSGFIAEFNAFATLPKDWKAKYQVASGSLDKMLASAAAAPAPPPRPCPPPLRRRPTANAAGVWDPTVVEKLKDVRKHLDGFEKATGDPLFIVEDIEKLLDEAGASSGTVTLDAAKLAALKEQLGQDQGGRRRDLESDLRLKCEMRSAKCEVRRCAPAFRTSIGT